MKRYDLPAVRIELGESAIFTRVMIDGLELHGVTRVWFDSGDMNQGDGPTHSWRNATRVHVEFFPRELIVEGLADTDLIAQQPKAVIR